ncbi:unnamed protein product [Protopolystoma xenopodis]|uniref:Uncharacterized protein n=1 Tax=Protopolystoma xenopodis TaxID=117903 RepID=A0A3S4ZV70_9PLAT|nr:unnamed protein product [Protopolystoma xenopodis]
MIQIKMPLESGARDGDSSPPGRRRCHFFRTECYGGEFATPNETIHPLLMCPTELYCPKGQTRAAREMGKTGGKTYLRQKAATPDLKEVEQKM